MILSMLLILMRRMYCFDDMVYGKANGKATIIMGLHQTSGKNLL